MEIGTVRTTRWNQLGEVIMLPSKIEHQYTEPELRERLKEELLAGDRGGRPGEWSARKAQLLAQEYERQGGGYANEGRGPGAKSLDRWTEQAWQTRAETARAEHGGRMGRFVPREPRHPSAEFRGDPSENTAREDPESDLREPRTAPEQGAPPNQSGGTADRSLVDWTRDELYVLAKELGISGRSKMRKQDLLEAITRRTDNPEGRERFP